MSTSDDRRLHQHAVANREEPPHQHISLAPAATLPAGYHSTVASPHIVNKPSLPINALLAGSTYEAPAAANITSGLRWPSAQQFYPLAHKVPRTSSNSIHSLSPTHMQNTPYLNPQQPRNTSTRPNSAPRPTSPAERPYTPDSPLAPHNVPAAHRVSMPILSPHALPFPAEDLWIELEPTEHDQQDSSQQHTATGAHAVSTASRPSNMSAVEAVKAALGHNSSTAQPSAPPPSSPADTAQTPQASKPFNPITHTKIPLPPTIRCPPPSPPSEPAPASRPSTAPSRRRTTTTPAPQTRNPSPCPRSHSATQLTPTKTRSTRSQSPAAVTRGRSPARKTPAWCPAGANRSRSRSRGVSPSPASGLVTRTRGTTVSPMREPRVPRDKALRDQSSHTIITHTHMYADSDSICSDGVNQQRMEALASAVSAVDPQAAGQKLLQLAPSSSSSYSASVPSSGGAVQSAAPGRAASRSSVESRVRRGSRNIKLTDSEASSVDWSDTVSTTTTGETRKQWLDRMAAPKSFTSSVSSQAPSVHMRSPTPPPPSVVARARAHAAATAAPTSSPGSVSGNSLPSSHASHTSTLNRIAPSAAVAAAVEASRQSRLAAANALRRNKYALRRATSPSPIRGSSDPTSPGLSPSTTTTPSPTSVPRSSTTSLFTPTTEASDGAASGKFVNSFGAARNSTTSARYAASTISSLTKARKPTERGGSPTRKPRFLHPMEHSDPALYTTTASSVDYNDYASYHQGASSTSPPAAAAGATTPGTSVNPSDKVAQGRSRAGLDIRGPSSKVLLAPQVSGKAGTETTVIESLAFERSASSNYSDTIPTARNTINWTNSCSSAAASSVTDSPAAIMHHMMRSPTSSNANSLGRRQLPSVPSSGSDGRDVREVRDGRDHSTRVSSHGCVPQPKLGSKVWRKSTDTMLGRLMSAAAGANRTPDKKKEQQTERSRPADARRPSTPGGVRVVEGPAVPKRPATASGPPKSIPHHWMRLFSCARFDV